MWKRDIRILFVCWGWFRAWHTHTRIKKLFGGGTKRWVVLLALASVCNFYLLRTFIIWSFKAQAFKALQLWNFFILTRFILVTYSCAFVARYFLLSLATYYRESWYKTVYCIIQLLCSVKYRLSIGKLKMLITSERNNASTKTLYRKNRPRRPIHHIKLYPRTRYKHSGGEDRSLASVIQLSMWVLY